MPVGSEKSLNSKAKQIFVLFPLNFIKFLRKQYLISLYLAFQYLFIFVLEKKMTEDDFLQHLMLGLYEFKT